MIESMFICVTVCHILSAVKARTRNKDSIFVNKNFLDRCFFITSEAFDMTIADDL